jgi:hypothetical protein
MRVSSRCHDPAREVVDTGIIGVEVVRVVVVAEKLPQQRVGKNVGLVVKQCDRVVRMGGEHEDPQVALQVDPTGCKSLPKKVFEMDTDGIGVLSPTTGGTTASGFALSSSTTSLVAAQSNRL